MATCWARPLALQQSKVWRELPLLLDLVLSLELKVDRLERCLALPWAGLDHLVPVCLDARLEEALVALVGSAHLRHRHHQLEVLVVSDHKASLLTKP